MISSGRTEEKVDAKICRDYEKRQDCKPKGWTVIRKTVKGNKSVWKPLGTQWSSLCDGNFTVRKTGSFNCPWLTIYLKEMPWRSETFKFIESTTEWTLALSRIYNQIDGVQEGDFLIGIAKRKPFWPLKYSLFFIIHVYEEGGGE